LLADAAVISEFQRGAVRIQDESEEGDPEHRQKSPFVPLTKVHVTQDPYPIIVKGFGLCRGVAAATAATSAVVAALFGFGRPDKGIHLTSTKKADTIDL